MMRSRGFTLIELLVVIAIIGVLSSIILTSLNQAKIKAQHAQTIAEVKQIESALTQVADDNNGQTISTGGALVCLGTTSCYGGTATNNATLDAALAKYIKIPPVDSADTSGAGGYFLYKSPSNYLPCDTSNSCSSAIPGSANSYDIVWLPASTAHNTSPNSTTDCPAENAIYGIWDGFGSQHGGGVGTYRQCGVAIEQ